MKSLTDKILTYTISGIAGAIAGYMLIHSDISWLNHDESCIAVIITSIALCVLVSIALVEHQEEMVLQKNTKIRNETVALITHEMRTGLTSTGWALEMVLKKYKEAISSEDTEMLQGVIKSIRTTVMHSVNLLDISLLDIGKLAIALEVKELKVVGDMFKEIVEKYKLGAERKHIALTANINLESNRKVEVDTLRLRIILENLLENAMQYTVLETKKIHVEASNTDTDLVINVRDTGIGIPQEEKEKIFSEFFRASNARKTLSSGSGIGLFTCAQYVKAHRGKISFESEVGKGTAFLITIPLKTIADVNEFIDKI